MTDNIVQDNRYFCHSINYPVHRDRKCQCGIYKKDCIIDNNVKLDFVNLLSTEKNDTAVCEVMLNNKLTSSGSDSRTSRAITFNITAGRQKHSELILYHTPARRARASVDARAPQQPPAARDCPRGARDDGGLCRLPGADRLHNRDPGQLSSGGDLQTGGRWLRGAALTDVPGAREEREGERRAAAETAGDRREDEEL